MIKLLFSIFKYPISFLKFNKFGKNIRLGYGGKIAHPEGISIGSNVFIAANFVISGKSLEIGNNVLIGPRLTIECDDHKFNKVGAPMWSYRNERDVYHIKICNDVWMGANVTILKGVIVGEGTIVGACSLLSKSVPPYTISIGIPCKPIKTRFTVEELKQHLILIKSNCTFEEVISEWKRFKLIEVGI